MLKDFPSDIDHKRLPV